MGAHMLKMHQQLSAQGAISHIAFHGLAHSLPTQPASTHRSTPWPRSSHFTI